MFYAAYPAGATPAPPAKNVDPGRVRFEPLFITMYGDCFKGEVAKIKEVMGRSTRLGMRTFDQSLFELYENGYVSY